ncbi:MAG: hypothetical protein AAF311_13795 [Pseudomonadota bacterium]
MPRKTFTPLIAASTLLALGASGAAFAQDQTPDLTIEADTVQVIEQPDMLVHMTEADLDLDGTLDPDEFVSYSVAMAQAGDDAAGALVTAGDYDAHFRKLDTDEDGRLTEVELKAEASADDDADDKDDGWTTSEPDM